MTMPRKAPRGRPSDYSEAMTDSICEKLASGDSLRTVCAEDGMPDTKTVFRWLAAHDDFAAKYARAREAQAEVHYTEMDRLEVAIEDGSLNAQAGSVILANKRWRLEKLKAKVFGAAVTLKGDKDNPLQIAKPVDLSDAALLALAAGDKAPDG